MFPLFGKKPSAGLTGVSVTDGGASIARVVRANGAAPRVTACAFRTWPAGAARDKALERMVSDLSLKRGRFTTLLNPGDYNLLLAEAPDVAPEELAAAIRWRIKDLIDFPVADAAIDVFDVPGDGSSSRQRSVYAVAARRAAVQARIDLLTGADLDLDVIDIGEMAQRNLAALLPEDERGVVTVSFAEHGGLITVTRQGELYLSRNLDIGLAQLGGAGDGRTEVFDRIVLEVQRSLDYYESYFRMASIGHLAVAPLPAEVPGLIEHLDGNLNLSAAYMNLPALMDFEVDVAPSELHECLWAVGAALRDEETA